MKLSSCFRPLLSNFPHQYLPGSFLLSFLSFFLPLSSTFLFHSIATCRILPLSLSSCLPALLNALPLISLCICLRWPIFPSLPARLILPPSSLPTFLYQTSSPFSYLSLSPHPPNFRSSSLPHLSHASHCSQAVWEDYNHFRTITSGSELIRTLSEKFKSCNLNRPLRDLWYLKTQLSEA